MFVIESSSAKAAHKMSVLMAIVAFFITLSFGALLTMHFFVKQSRQRVPKGLRIFGLQITR
jgi:hypothetical protein